MAASSDSDAVNTSTPAAHQGMKEAVRQAWKPGWTYVYFQHATLIPSPPRLVKEAG